MTAIAKEKAMRIRWTRHTSSTPRQTYCDYCGYALVERTRDQVHAMRPVHA
jgi:hypothetical protein